jgi:UDP-N-acetylglucosamine:LPS N-acetylglucosamine transferase
MKVLYLPAETGTGHNMRALAVAAKVRELFPESEQHVYLGSKSAVFTPMFEAHGVQVHVAPSERDHANTSQLGRSFDWTTYVTGYLDRTFISGDRMLNAVALIAAVRPDVVVSDYNVAASLAAEVSGVPHVLITERYDFTLGQLDNDSLVEAGFAVGDTDEVDAIRSSLTTLFDWVTRRARAVLTDKPTVDQLDRGTPVFRAIAAGNGHFVGPIVRDACAADPAPREEVDERFGLAGSQYIVAGFGGTTMFTENKDRLLANYLTAFEKLRAAHPQARLVVIGRQEFTEDIDGVVFLNYVTDWHSLVKHAKVVLSPPGWISVTEMAVMNAPVAYVLSGRDEYHELEAMRRLALLGYTTVTEPDAATLLGILQDAFSASDTFTRTTAEASRAIAPTSNGAEVAAKLIGQAVAEARAHAETADAA